MTFCSLEGQTALVTGASRGIGKAIALSLAEAGARVVINYRSQKAAAEEVLKEIQKISPTSIAIPFDVSKPSEIESAFKKLDEQNIQISILVANAGISKDGLLLRLKEEDIQEVLSTNLTGTMHLIRLACRPMMKNHFGRIICVSSVVGQTGNAGQTIYSASKAAIFGLTKSVAAELGSRKITCNAVAPGFIETEMTGELSSEVKEAYLEKVPLQRFGAAKEVAGAVRFLASQEAGYITGATIDINGGLSMR